ncbi:hypothetical protein HHI36_010344, partial [Cryptolaemus montrouzieri]
QMLVKMSMSCIGLLLTILALVRADVLKTEDGKSTLSLEVVKNNGILLRLSQGHDTKLSAHIGKNLNLTEIHCNSINCSFTGVNEDIVLNVRALQNSFQLNWISPDSNITFNDCYDLNRTNLSWFGGPEVLVTQWPIEKLVLKNRPYISSKLDNGAVVERYWLNSKGGFVFVDHKVPLFVDQNNEEEDRVCFKSAIEPPFDRDQNNFTYIIAARTNSRDAHLYAVNNLLGKPATTPDVRMVKEPIWTTWGKYKADIDDSSVLEYLRNIYSHNFTKGQIEIDDKWEVCYGDQTFDLGNKFRNIKETVETIHSYGFRATLWTHPFVNSDCVTPVYEGSEHEYFVNSSTGNSITSWWNGNSSYVIDFTNDRAASWFLYRLLQLNKKYGIDGFKCDAGENDWLPEKPILDTSYGDAPNDFTTQYVKTCSRLGSLVEVRSAFRTQELSIFVRMLDKDSVWGNNNGLKALVQSLIQFNMIGYSYVLPDLVGGNGYNGVLPTPELLVRWTQANTFMPSLQFSYLPWELKSAPFNTTEIVRKYVDLHEKYSDVIIEAMVQTITKGTPTNPPIWWVDPTDPVALAVDDEFLLGDKILVAPILDEGAIFRNVYLPNGTWIDGNNGSVYRGRTTLRNYSAPIEVLPYFIRV